MYHRFKGLKQRFMLKGKELMDSSLAFLIVYRNYVGIRLKHYFVDKFQQKKKHIWN